jgi:HEAT repeat protein
MKRPWLAQLFVACLLVLIFLSMHRREREPVYAGRPVGEWLDGGYEQISMAMHETGPPAAAVVFSKLRRDHPVYGSWAKYRGLWMGTPQAVRRFLPAPKSASFDELTGCTALLDIGPAVIPCLVGGLTDHNEAVRLSSALALNHFQQRGSNISPALPQLVHTTLDPNPRIRQVAASVLTTLN